ncbi:MAG: DUF2336 domain-containing protein [Alphaproteobacteria bacterium]|nr:DUF2336 domain-containing protein [Alphaproteobacteria bacterium]
MHLTQSDVERLTQDRSDEARAATAVKVAQAFEAGQISDKDRHLVEDIFRHMVSDAAVRVRSALSEALKSSPHIPREVAVALANDVNEVAIPMLASSDVLTDADLLAIIAGSDPEKQASIAGRSAVSADVSDALADTRNEEVIATLISNDGADISEDTLGKVLDEFSDSDKVKAPMARRNRIPAAVAERLVTMVSDHLRAHIATHHDLPDTVASDLILQSREQATITLSSDENASELVRALVDNGRLTPSIVVRALCLGDLPFFEWVIATLANLPIQNARTLVHDPGPLGLKAAFERARLPESIWPIVRAAMDIVHETEYDGSDTDRDRYHKLMIQRVITCFEHPGQDFDPESLTYLLNKLTDLMKPVPDAA